MSLENDEPTGNISGIDADALMQEIESGSRDIPMTAPAESAPAAQTPAPQATPPAPTADEIEFQHEGKPIKISRTDPKFTTWLQQGYNYAQRAQLLNQERAKFDTERQTLEKQYSPYKTVDEYAKQNPDWWTHVQQSFEQRNAQPKAGDSPELAQVKAQIRQEIMAELKPIQDKFTSIEQKEQAEQVAREDQALGTEIQSIREKYSNLDWATPDEAGMTLEQRIVKHAIDNKIESFRAAFRDYSFDHLAKLHEERGKETIQQDLQKRQKLGIIGQSSTPKKGIQPAQSVKNKSYDDLYREALSEMNAG